jgi:hypothetical protein
MYSRLAENQHWRVLSSVPNILKEIPRQVITVLYLKAAFAIPIKIYEIYFSLIVIFNK